MVANLLKLATAGIMLSGLLHCEAYVDGPTQDATSGSQEALAPREGSYALAQPVKEPAGVYGRRVFDWSVNSASDAGGSDVWTKDSPYPHPAYPPCPMACGDLSDVPCGCMGGVYCHFDYPDGSVLNCEVYR